MRNRRLAAIVAGMLGVAVFLGVAVPVLANGLTGADAPSRIPTTARSYAATFVDVGGTRVQATSKVSFNGETFVYGRFGAGQVTIPFERIDTVTISKADDPLKRTATITLNDGSEPVRVVLEDDTAWYGRTRFGNYKVEVRDIRTVSGFREIPKP